MFLLEFIFSQLMLKYKEILISFSHIHVQRYNVFMYVHVISIVYIFFFIFVYIFFFIKNNGYFGIFLVISVNLRLFRYCIISTVSPHFGSANMFYSLDSIMSKIADI